MNRNAQSGFTLIELVVVIVLLGILAATAAPKFIDLRSDAVIATLEAMEGGLKSANSMVYAKAVIHGEDEKASGSIDVDGNTVLTTDGYITATAQNLTFTIDSSLVVVAAGEDVIDADFGLFDVSGSGAASNVMIIPNGYNSGSNCLINYNTTSGVTEPAFYALYTNGC